MSRREFGKGVRRDARKRADGKCEMRLEDGSRCTCPLTVGKFQYDHVIPDWMGGEPTLANCQVICDPCHKAKTRQDAADRAKAQRREDRHHGIYAPKRPIQGQGFRPSAPQQRATGRVVKDGWPTLGRRNLFAPDPHQKDA